MKKLKNTKNIIPTDSFVFFSLIMLTSVIFAAWINYVIFFSILSATEAYLVPWLPTFTFFVTYAVCILTGFLFVKLKNFKNYCFSALFIIALLLPTIIEGLVNNVNESGNVLAFSYFVYSMPVELSVSFNDYQSVFNDDKIIFVLNIFYALTLFEYLTLIPSVLRIKKHKNDKFSKVLKITNITLIVLSVVLMILLNVVFVATAGS